jgi:hypothetical protein
MTTEIRELEVRLLVLKYGADAVLRTLAKIKHMNPDGLEASLKRLEEGNPVRRRSRKRTAMDVVQSMVMENGGKTQALRSLAQRFDNKIFLPSARDIRTFLSRHGEVSRSVKSRAAAANAVFRVLAGLPLPELQQLLEHSSPNRGSDFAELADEIMGSNRSST